MTEWVKLKAVCYYRMSPDGKRVIFGGRARFTQVDAETSAPILRRFMTDRFPQMKDVKLTHAWTGNPAMGGWYRLRDKIDRAAANWG